MITNWLPGTQVPAMTVKKLAREHGQ